MLEIVKRLTSCLLHLPPEGRPIKIKTDVPFNTIDNEKEMTAAATNRAIGLQIYVAITIPPQALQSNKW